MTYLWGLIKVLTNSVSKNCVSSTSGEDYQHQHFPPPPFRHLTRVGFVSQCQTLPKRNEKMSKIIQHSFSASCLQL